MCQSTAHNPITVKSSVNPLLHAVLRIRVGAAKPVNLNQLMKQVSFTHKRFYWTLIVLISGWLASITSYGQCTTSNTLTVPAQYTTPALVGNGNFNAIVFGNVNSSSGDTEGRLAVGGNFTFNPAVAGDGYSVGLAGPGTGRSDAPAQTDNFIVNQTFTNQSGLEWRVRGNFIYTANATGSLLPSHAPNEGTNSQTQADSRLNFPSLKTYYTTLSDNLNGLTPVGSYTVNGNDITLIGDGTARNYVFTIDFDQPVQNPPVQFISSINFQNIPVAGSTILINIRKTGTIVFAPGSMSSAYQNVTLFNFPNETSVTISNFALEGSFLAPRANLNGSDGNINGQSVVGGNFTQTDGFEFHNSCLNQSNPLPVTLVSFSAAKEEQATQLTWTTENEQNNRGFAIEHSLDAKSWKQLTFITGFGTSTESHAYTYRHEQPGPGINYYRLGQVDHDGQTTYSSIRAVSFEDVIVVYPNPVAEKVYLNLPQSGKYPYQVTLIDGLGRSVLAVPTRTYSAAAELDIHQLATGVYVLKLVREGAVTVKKLIVRR